MALVATARARDGSVREKFATAAAAGERVLRFATKRLPRTTERLTFSDLEADVVFLGLIGFIDPPRDEALLAIAQCRSAGVDVKMITGDHATALAIARQLDLADDPRAMTGAELDPLSDEALQAVVPQIAVFGRQVRWPHALSHRGLSHARPSRPRSQD